MAQQQQSSRLCRLLTLLDTGSTQTTRLTAARQIGDIAKSHPQDLSSLLRKVLHYLRSKKWDTRVAAAHAIGAIVLNVKPTSLNELLNSLATKLGEDGLSGNVDEVVASGNLQSKLLANAPFRSFEMNTVLEFGALLASGGQEYDILNDNSKNSRDRVARQKKNLRRRLGLDMCEQFMDVNEMIGDEDLIEQKSNVHANGALQYLLKLCSHPLLVLGEKVKEPVASDLSAMINGCSDISTELHKVQHSPKLVALQEILDECGIGSDASSSDGTLSVGQHRVLIFAQQKALLDIIERDLFQAHMKSVTYMRLDGTVVPEKRFEIVKTFNSDPTIDVLLLTTHVGGLGLNLTSADTIVFMEHDWNPMRDHQAMDIAHRLGQKRVVNVHRLIMRGTLEEKVMSLHRFKVSVANTVINAENASMKTMNTDQLLDLFAAAETSKKGGASTKKGSDDNDQTAGTGKGIKAILGNLEELWDQSQYTEEYNLSHFLAKLNGY